MSASLPATTVSIPPQLAANIESWGVTHARFVSDGVSTYIKPTYGHRGMNRHRTFKLYPVTNPNTVGSTCRLKFTNIVDDRPNIDPTRRTTNLMAKILKFSQHSHRRISP
ncbi:uncharacterized protein PODANS_2_3940 [Podospora anserina S mat+]|uniref:Podospora anserina S mat+ genomic DNA chromosome 2, supercontig 2 n=1 Tax=Podospora anserina (strain S / ATCC MYA-4624 / DSM 980 / FGSC 10383) TaxID=515849 RepID=B2B595_PODAN|nr:uncharacterized protein PODANS_2_3940 [Podospora anserina S mat+]CAP72970.1 unnamed protein product [Podospora anserina S mat+]CDP25370.1 Putative protein of unknown function [Podospora anserina S mat+]